jgi:hypothetical protein
MKERRVRRKSLKEIKAEPRIVPFPLSFLFAVKVLLFIVTNLNKIQLMPKFKRK